MRSALVPNVAAVPGRPGHTGFPFLFQCSYGTYSLPEELLCIAGVKY